MTNEVPAYAIVAGVPAKIMGWMSAYGDVLEFDAEGWAVDSQGVKYQKVSRYSVQKLG
ncbi:MAG: hypothetical protein ACRC8Y_26620 [Chroococcales cyanobacterium]